jgi:hypothetical protein
MEDIFRPKQPQDCTELIFQTLDWYCDDFVNEKTEFLEYKIFSFGVSTDGCPITLKINGFNPFFFIEVPETWDRTCVYSVKNALNAKSIKSIDFLERKKYYGFENNKIRKFLKLSFYSSKAMRTMRYRIEQNTFMISGKEYTFPLYESNIDPILRFTHIRDILTAAWIKVSKFTFNEEEEYFECDWNSISNYKENVNKMANTRILYFDIEACSDDGSFPNALKLTDRCTQICAVISDTLTGNVKKFLFNIGTIDAIEDTTVLQFKSEKEMLIKYSQFIRDSDPDIIVGYNIFGFDNGYLFERSQILEITNDFNYQSKLKSHYTEIQKKVLNNQQSGFNDWKMTRFIGRTHIDLLQVIKKDFKLESYKLNSVGEHFLNEGKDDVSPKEIFEAWNKTHGDRVKRTKVGKYCVQDTVLCLKLFEKFAVLANYLEMAKITRVPLEYLITRGQSIKVFSQIAYETRKTGYLIPVLPKMETEGKFQGATVLAAKVGYYNRPVCGLDFASLYPSIMIAHNMCYSTVVLDPKYLNLPDVIYSTIECGQNLNFTFVQNQPGVLSGILESLWKTRKVTKKEFLNDLPKIMNAMDQPTIDGINTWYASKAAAELKLKVVLSGVGGDELFFGYNHFKQIAKFESLLKIFRKVSFFRLIIILIGKLLHLIKNNSKFKFLNNYLDTIFNLWILKRSVSCIEDVNYNKKLKIFSYIQKSMGKLSKDSYLALAELEAKLYLRNQLLRDSDWASMSHGVELRTPFVDFHLLNNLKKIIKFFPYYTKSYLLNSVLDKKLPISILKRKKTGFAIPIKNWLLEVLSAKKINLSEFISKFCYSSLIKNGK